MIKTIIFDWGGVLTRGSWTGALIDLFSQRFKIDFAADYNFIDQLIIKMDHGEMEFTEFVDKFNKKYKEKVKIEDMFEMFSSAVRPNNEVIEYLKELKDKVQLLMLSNNHEPIITYLGNNQKEMMDLFEKKYFSAIEKDWKPNKSIYEKVIKENNLNPEETIFIDDKLKNVHVAFQLGMKGIIFANIDQLKKEIEDLFLGKEQEIPMFKKDD